MIIDDVTFVSVSSSGDERCLFVKNKAGESIEIWMDYKMLSKLSDDVDQQVDFDDDYYGKTVAIQGTPYVTRDASPKRNKQVDVPTEAWQKSVERDTNEIRTTILNNVTAIDELEGQIVALCDSADRIDEEINNRFDAIDERVDKLTEMARRIEKKLGSHLLHHN